MKLCRRLRDAVRKLYSLHRLAKQVCGAPDSVVLHSLQCTRGRVGSSRPAQKPVVLQIDGPEADGIPGEVHRLGGRVIGGLRSVHMVCSTALANGLDTSAVRDAVNAAARDRGKLFADKHREELEGWLLGNKLFRSLYDGPPLAAPDQVHFASCVNLDAHILLCS